MMQQQRSQHSVSNAELYAQQQQASNKQVSFRKSPPGQPAARRSQSSMRALANTPRHYPLSMMNHPRAQSTGRAASEPGNSASFTLDYDDPEEITKAILRLREQRERDAAERSASRSMHRSSSSSRQPSSREQSSSSQQQQRPPVLEPKQSVPSNAMRQQQLHQLQHAMALQKSHSQGSSSTNSHNHPTGMAAERQGYAADRQNYATANTAQKYRAPSPSVAQRQGPSGAVTSNAGQQLAINKTLSQQSSGSSEQYQSRVASQPPGNHLSGVYRSRFNNQQAQQTNHRASPSPQIRQQQQPPASRMVDPNGDEVVGANTNKRIDGLMEELEELRFFHELDTDNQPQQQQHQQLTKVLGAMRPATPSSNGNASVPRVPLMIGVPSDGMNGNGSSSNNKLPPPPINFMDPREISKLDRHTLELESQKMVRSVQLLTSEKLALEAEMEVLATDQTHNKKRIQQLEQTLTQVKQQLALAKKEVEALRITTVRQYESKLSENVEKLQQTQKQVDGLKDERDSLRLDLEKRNTQLNELKHRSKSELQEEKEAAQAREAVLELQLAEVINTVEELKLKIKRKDDEVEELRLQVQNAREVLVIAKKQHESAHQAELQALQEQVAAAESKYQRAIDEREQVQRHLESQEKQLESVRQQAEEQATLISKMTERLDDIHEEYRQKFGELKETYEAKEKRRLNEMVVSQSKQVEEYERRLLSMQQQLTMATDRHHTEIRQKDVDIETKLERERRKVREQMEDEHRRATERLGFDLEATKRDYEDAETERQRLREALAAPNKEHMEAQRSWEEKDVRQQQEICRLRQQMERLTSESSDKESRILELTIKMADRTKKHEERINDMENQHATSLLARDEVIAEQKRKLRGSDLAIKSELSRQETEFRDSKSLLETRIAELETELEHATTSLELSKRSLQSAELTSYELASLTAKLERLTSELDSERTTHESTDAALRTEILALESKLGSSESKLKAKLAVIDDLEATMRKHSESHACLLRDTQKQFESLQQNFDENQEQLVDARSKVEAQALELADLSRQRRELDFKAESADLAASELSTKVRVLEQSLEVQMRIYDEFRIKSDKNMESVQSSFAVEKLALESRIAELESCEKILRQENDELQESCDVIEANIHKLRTVNEGLEAKAEQLAKALEDIADLRKMLTTKDDEIIQSGLDLSNVRHKLDIALQTIEEYESKIDQTNHVTVDLQKQAQQASQVSDRYASTAKELQSRIESEQNEKRLLHDELQVMKKKLKEKEKELEEMSELAMETTQAIASRDSLSEQVDQLKSQLEAKTLRIIELEQANERSIFQSKKIEEVHVLKATEIKTLEDRIIELEVLASTRKKQLDKIETELDERSMQLAQLQQKHSERDIAHKEAVSELCNSKAAAEAQIRARDAELVMHVEQIERLERSLLEIREKEAQATTLNEELRAKLRHAESDIREKVQRLNDLAVSDGLSSQLQTEVQQLTRTKSALEAKIRRLKEEQDEREEHVRQAAERSSNQILELQMQVEDLTAAKTSLRSKLTEAEKELEKTVDSLRSATSLHSADMASLNLRLAEQLDAKNQLAAKVDDLESKLTLSKEMSQLAIEKEKMIENLQVQVDEAAKDNRSLKLRIGDVETELDRKEKQIKEVVNRYSQEVAVLSDKLEDQTKECRNLQKELDHFKSKTESASDASNESKTLRDRIASMEKAIDVERALTRDAEKAKKRVEKELATTESSKHDLQERFEKVSSERNEVIAALEEVIHEVQSREDEIDTLADALRRREEELEHARMFTSKALSSAQEIKAKYKDRSASSDNGRHAELEDQVASLTAALGQMKKNNYSLQRKLARLEEELTQKEGEYSELKVRMGSSTKSQTGDEADRYVAKSHPGEPPACTIIESASTAASTMSGGTQALDSPSRSLAFTESMSDVGADPWGMQPFSNSSSDSSDNSTSFAGVRAELGEKKSTERNALRKYVRNRYMNAKSVSNS
ncbi:hypothetical protein MPSEU_000188800 [Mayamaea pseudoterrestris]|nr:hypothetical protein MPSEU_000188800 [Mayamaea pseudoterrestris]